MSKRNSTKHFNNNLKNKNTNYFNNNKKEYINKLVNKRISKNFITNNYGLKINEVDYKTALQNINKINKRNTQRYNSIKDKIFFAGGKPTEMTIGERISLESNSNKIGDSAYSQRYGYFKNELKLDLNNFKTQKDLDNYLKSLKKNVSNNHIKTKLKIYKENYISAIYKKLGYDDDTEKIVNKIKNLSPTKLENIYLSNEEAFIQYVYTLEDRDNKVSNLINIFGVNG